MTMDWFNDKGFNTPLLVDESEGLGLVVPPSDFTVADVEQYVGKYNIRVHCCVYLVRIVFAKKTLDSLYPMYTYMYMYM